MEDEVTDIPTEQELQDIMNETDSGLDIPNKEDIPEPKTWSWKEGDKEIKATEEQLLKWGQMGRNAPQKIGELNQNLTKAQEQLKKLEEYRQIDEWAQKNPDIWSKITQSYQNPSQQIQEQTQIPAEVQQYLQPLMQQLTEMKSFVSEIQKEREQGKLKQEDTALDQEIKSIREQHADLDWQSPDESGLTLEQRVLEHASKLGTTSFKAAFRDMNHETLLQRATLKAKEELIKERRQKSKLGLLDSPAPNKTEVLNYDPRKSSDREILEAALKEMVS